MTEQERPSTDLDVMVCFALYNASRATTQAYRALLEQHDLTYPQYLVLVLLWGHDDQTVGEIGEQLQLDSGTLSPMLRRMERTGIVTRTRTRDDERVVSITLTDRGQRLQSELAHVPACIADGTGLTRTSAAAFVDTLRDITTRMRNVANTPA